MKRLKYHYYEIHARLKDINGMVIIIIAFLLAAAVNKRTSDRDNL